MSEILTKKSTGAGLDAMAAILPHLAEIAQDEELSKARARIMEDKDATVFSMAVAAFPIMAVKHRSAVYGIVSAITGKTPEEIDAQPLEETIAVFSGATGGEIMGFFSYCARMVARM